MTYNWNSIHLMSMKTGLAAEFTVGYEIHKRNPCYYKWL